MVNATTFQWLGRITKLARPVDMGRPMKATLRPLPPRRTPPRETPPRKTPSRKTLSTRGAVMVEYAFLLAFVFIPLSIGIVEGGKILINNYRLTRGWVLKNSP